MYCPSLLQGLLPYLLVSYLYYVCIIRWSLIFKRNLLAAPASSSLCVRYKLCICGRNVKHDRNMHQPWRLVFERNLLAAPGSRRVAFGATWVAPPPRWRFAPLMTKAAVLSGASFDMNKPRSNSASKGPKVPRRTQKRVPFLLEKKRRGGWLPRGHSDSKNFAFRPP